MMKKQFQAAYVPIGVGTFHMPSAQAMFDASAKLLKSICEDTAVPEEMLLNTDLLKAFLDTVDPDLIILTINEYCTA